jgi:diadenylate cyclase
MFPEWLKDTFTTVVHIIQNIRFVDILDILVLSVMLYFLFRFIRDKRAGKLAVGLVFMLAFVVFSEIIGMRTMQYIFQNLFQVGIISIVIIFQPEFRSLLEKVGANPIKGLKNIGEVKREDSLRLSIREISTAVAEMSATKTGALIAYERETLLGDIISTGVKLDAQVNSFLVRNIFFNKAPLHDGAMIISDARIRAAGCLLPLSAQRDINKDLGTRHRAAIGLSENSDAVVIVVSEETGTVSIAVNGNLSRGYTTETLKDKLVELLVPDVQISASKVKAFGKKKNKNSNERSK